MTPNTAQPPEGKPDSPSSTLPRAGRQAVPVRIEGFVWIVEVRRDRALPFEPMVVYPTQRSARAYLAEWLRWGGEGRIVKYARAA